MKNNEKLAQQFYDFIIKYTEFMKHNKDIFRDALSLRELEIEKAMYTIHKDEYSPWTKLSEGKEVEKLSEIILADTKECINYLRLNDLISEQYHLLAKHELTQYYKSQNKKKSEDSIIDEIENYRKQDTLDNTMFSSTLKQFHHFYKDIIKLTDRWIYLRRDNARTNAINQFNSFVGKLRVENLAKKYTNLIKHYEKFLSRHQKKIEDIPEKDSELFNLIYYSMESFYDKQYQPWKKLPKNHIEEFLTDIFMNNPNEAMTYLGALNCITDSFIFPAVDELESFSKSNGLEPDNEKLFDTVCSYKSKKELDSKIFSKEIIDFFDIYKEADTLEDELSDFINSKQKEKDLKEIEEEYEK